MGPNPGTVPPASTPAGSTPEPTLAMLASECPAVQIVDQMDDDERNHVLICALVPGHGGLHWDPEDDISWKRGTPNA